MSTLNWSTKTYFSFGSKVTDPTNYSGSTNDLYFGAQALISISASVDVEIGTPVEWIAEWVPVDPNNSSGFYDGWKNNSSSNSNEYTLYFGDSNYIWGSRLESGTLTISAKINGVFASNKLIISASNTDQTFPANEYGGVYWDTDFSFPSVVVDEGDCVASNLQKITISTYVPAVTAVAGQEYRAAYSAWEDVTTCKWVSSTTYNQDVEYKLVKDDYGQYTWVAIPKDKSFYGLYGSTTQSYVCTTTKELVYHPAQAYVEAVEGHAAYYLHDYQLGWNARARSQKAMDGDGVYTFTISEQAVGAIVGLTAFPAEAGYSDILFGFSVQNGEVAIYEGGVKVQTIDGTAVSGARYAIERMGSVITYTIDAAVVRTVDAVAGTLYLGAALYSGGDSVGNCCFKRLYGGTGSVELRAASMSAADAATYADVQAEMHPLTLAASGMASGAARLAMKAADVVGGDASGYAQALLEMRPLDVTAQGGYAVPSYSVAGLGMMPMSTKGLLVQGGHGGAACLLSPLQVLAGDYLVYGEVRAAIAPASAAGGSGTPGEVNMVQFADVGLELDTASVILVTMTIAGVLTGVITAVPVAAVSMIERATMRSGSTLQSIIAVLMQSVGSGGYAGSTKADSEVWVVNVETGATTRYENFDFNSMATIGGRAFGLRDDGLYAMDGDTDAGDSISTRVNLGRTNFGTSLRKAIDAAYLGVSGGRVIVKVVADGQTFFYKTSASGADMATRRALFGRGLRANFYELELLNEQGEDFELASVEFRPVTLSRRI